MFIKPHNNLKIRDPQTQRHIPPEGTEVHESSFWLRRIQDGDVSVIESLLETNLTAAKTIETKTTKKGTQS